tara:strand:- start:11 stop:214 length:204 start_codon:yes stop_codon:yes gene_type:complete
MQVGDLVRLSAYGNKVKSNHRSIKPSDLGMIVEIENETDFPFQVKWVHLPFGEKMMHSRKDLKHARR